MVGLKPDGRSFAMNGPLRYCLLEKSVEVWDGTMATREPK